MAKVYKKKHFQKKKLRKKFFLKKIKTQLKRLYRYRSSFINLKSNLFLLPIILKKYSFKIYLRIRSNNVFCTLIDLGHNKTLLNISSGKYKLNTSKKKLKYNTKIILNLFLKDIQSYLTCSSSSIIVEIISSIKNRKQIIRILKKKIHNQQLILYLKPLKCFNGCRPKKRKRKKRRKLRIFK
jgi:ribosomal protein S11